MTCKLISDPGASQRHLVPLSAIPTSTLKACALQLGFCGTRTQAADSRMLLALLSSKPYGKFRSRAKRTELQCHIPAVLILSSCLCLHCSQCLKKSYILITVTVIVAIKMHRFDLQPGCTPHSNPTPSSDYDSCPMYCPALT